MKSKVIFLSAVMMACLGAHAPATSAERGILVAQGSSDSGYRVGDTLAPVKRAPVSGYRDIGWDSLLPEGWSVEKEMEKLNLTQLDDNDPKAREAMKRIREMWDKAPANPKLDNKRVSIPGFVVPLDGEREKTREFLLVPYFGACIHAPAPPANQIIHVKVKGSSKLLTPAALISGTIRTVRSDTSMGITGYEMTADKVEPYTEESPFPI